MVKNVKRCVLLSRVGDKWSILIIVMLGDGSLRFNQWVRDNLKIIENSRAQYDAMQQNATVD
ncbi:hypothetical protein [Neptunicella marina]|uniref:HTH hxlR-type domain-containing protein n=1 Tax=Neptunicella marina TaxID=2125989 RepID=A0A8J6IVP2_9ALTE|nr:hypothetical protein [Neptunicella marina]MBC3767074.1 hypothetical protein [Neptunicella marina]